MGHRAIRGRIPARPGSRRGPHTAEVCALDNDHPKDPLDTFDDLFEPFDLEEGPPPKQKRGATGEVPAQPDGPVPGRSPGPPPDCGASESENPASV